MRIIGLVSCDNAAVTTGSAQARTSPKPHDLYLWAGKWRALPRCAKEKGTDMSKREYDKFMQALRDDVQLAQKLRDRVAAAGETNSVETTVEFARAHGFKVDAKDVRAARA